jgi:ABC-2 type transport system permease protein
MTTWTQVARKELRAYFLSPVALIFVATFLFAALFSFFWVEGFFVRGVADIRPLFAWLPVLLAFLVPALGMRLWAEEERTGTMEMLGTLPLTTWSAVAGKFVSGLSLVAVALALTLPVPCTVSLLGDLDWGPVVGGYVATLLLAGAYLAITLCISAVTSNQLVALVFGALTCGLLYVVGSDTVTGFFGGSAAELLRGIGAGARFDSIQRGVLDLRDLSYYAGLIGFFLSLNVLLLERRRWSGSARGASARLNARLAVALLGANVIALNVAVAPVRGARIDLTENHEYSISRVTRDLLEGLDEPLLLRGYLSDKTHPLLAPLVPQVRDMLEEYAAISPNVRAEIVDPTTDEEAEKEAGEVWGIRSVPFQFSDRHEASVVNSFFHVLVTYGDQHAVLGFDELIEVSANGMDVDVRLRNLEYDLTRAIQKTVFGFQSLESVFARLPEPARFTLYASAADKLPQGFGEVPETIEAVAKKLATRSGGKFTYTRVDPDAPGAATSREALLAQGVQPLSASLFGGETFFLHMILSVGDRAEQLLPSGENTEAEIETSIVSALKRGGPGSLKTVGLAIGGAPQEAPQPQFPGQPPPPAPGALPYSTLEQMLGESYEVAKVDLMTGVIPSNVDVLLVLDPHALDDAALWALDQFVMRGGSAIVAAGGRVLDLAGLQSGGLSVKTAETGLTEWLAHQGIRVGTEIVMDAQNATFPIPITRNVGGFQMRQMQMLPYPAFPDVRPDGFAKGHPALAGLPGAILHWASTVELVDAQGESSEADGALPRREVLLSSSPESWLLDQYSAQPDFDTYGELGWQMLPDRKKQPLAVAATGPFPSYWAGKEPPTLGGAEDAAALSGGLIETSPDRSRLVVIGSATFVSDPAVEISRTVSDAWLNNMQLIANLIDWSLEDVELLSIRGRGQQSRILRPTETATRKTYELINYALALLAVVGMGVFTRGRRRNVAPMELDPPSAAASEAREVA